MMDSNYLLNEIDDAIIILRLMGNDSPGPVIEANRFACKALGYTYSEFFQLFSSEAGFYTVLKQNFNKIYNSANEGAVYFGDNLLHKNGHTIAFRIKAFIGNWKGELCLFTIGKVVAEAEDDTSISADSGNTVSNSGKPVSAGSNTSSVELYRVNELIIDQNFSPVLITDKHQNIIRVNKAFTQVFGYQENEIEGLHPKVLSSGLVSKETYRELWQNLNTTGHWEGQLIDKTKSGKNVIAKTVINSVKDHEGEVINYIALFEDTTGLAEIESELNRSYLAVQNNFEELLEIKSDLEQSNKRLEAVITGSNSGTWEWNIQTGETIYNERWAEITGYSLAELSPVSIQSWIDLAHPEDLQVSNQKIDDYLHGKTDYYACQSRMKHKDGHWVWIEDKGKITEWDDSGKPLKMSGIHTDITELIQSRHTLKHQLEIEALITAISIDLTNITSTNLDEKILGAISAIGRFSKVDRTYLFLLRENGTIMDNTHEWCAEGIEPQIENLKDMPVHVFPWWMEKMHQKEVILFQRIDEMPDEAVNEKEVLISQKIISILVVPVYHGGELLGFIGFDSVMDEKLWTEFDTYTLQTFALSVANAIISARTQRNLLLAKEKAEVSEKQLHSLFENMFDGVAGCKLVIENEIPVDFVVLEVNRAFEVVTGLKDVAGKKVSEAIPDFMISDPGLFSIFSRVALSGIPERSELFVKSANNWYSISVYSMVTGYFVCVFNNINERKRAEEEIKQLNNELEKRVASRTAKLEAANKDLEAFSYSISHDLQSPLRSIDGFAYILQEEYADALPTEGKHVIQVILDTSAKMSNLINDMLTFSRVGNQEITKTSIDMVAMAESVFHELTTRIDRERIEFILRDMPVASGDPSMIRQLWVNLIGNAIKYSSKRPYPTIEIGVNIHFLGNIYFVKDNGTGFDMCYVNKLFTVFQRLHISKDFEGTGVGLAIVSRIIKRHNGHIWAEGKVNEGATFYFTLNDKKADKIKKRKPLT
jgi:PAS domain S-box-containing protein